MKRTKTKVGEFTVSTVDLFGVCETMVFDANGDDIDCLIVDTDKHEQAHKHMCKLYSLGELARYWAGSVSESVFRQVLQGKTRYIQAQ